MNFDQIIPIIYMIGVLILVLPSFLQSNSKLKQFLSNLSIWVIIVFPFKTHHPKFRVVRPTNRSMFLS